MTKDLFIEMTMGEAVIEADGYDLLVMGQPEGAGCFCAANSLLTNFLDRLQGNYTYIVMDNEAGMEHISRLTTNNVDVLLVVSDTSRRGLQAAVRINKLAGELSIGVAKSYAIVNQAKDELADVVRNILTEGGLELAGTVPEDSAVYDYDLNGRPTIELPEDSRSVAAAYKIFDKIFE